MEHKTLKYLRLFVPGFIIIVFSLPILLYYNVTSEILKTYQGIFLGIYPIIAIILGVFYHIFNARDKLWGKALSVIHKFIKEKIIKPFKEDKALFEKVNKIDNYNTFLIIHYSFIDNDELTCP